ncbi:hypothetical protein L596_008633 [Steinernema carpocapsae]|uniref:Uncharacterized protein n=1 Tax=Steinernema carpocapsae TaxID=34508 RepID=A0A4U5PD32_STECR|nr:hypothetical protein L596_008633 [Steinernema carpocapsae]
MRSQRGGIRADDGGKSASSTRSSVSTVPTLNNSWSSSHYRRMEGKTRKGDSNSSDSACANEAILRELERLQADATETNEDPTDPLDWPMATVMLIPPKQEKSKIRRNRRFSVCSSETAYPSERFSAHNVHVDAWEFARQNQLVEKLDRSMTLMIPKQASETAFDGPTKSSTTTELRRFYCPNIETAELSLRALPTGEFRLFPRDSTVRFQCFRSGLKTPVLRSTTKRVDRKFRALGFSKRRLAVGVSSSSSASTTRCPNSKPSGSCSTSTLTRSRTTASPTEILCIFHVGRL